MHFTTCWKVRSVAACHEPLIPCFLDNDLGYCTECCPPNIAVKRGRHQVVRMESGGKGKKTTGGAEEKSAHVVFRYPLDDDPRHMEPIARGSMQRRSNRQGSKKRKLAGSTSKTVCCGKCGKVGHNRRTCKVNTFHSQDSNDQVQTNNGIEMDDTQDSQDSVEELGADQDTEIELGVDQDTEMETFYDSDHGGQDDLDSGPDLGQ